MARKPNLSSSRSSFFRFTWIASLWRAFWNCLSSFKHGLSNLLFTHTLTAQDVKKLIKKNKHQSKLTIPRKIKIFGINKNIIRIKKSAFDHCYNLTTIDIHNSLAQFALTILKNNYRCTSSSDHNTSYVSIKIETLELAVLKNNIALNKVCHNMLAQYQQLDSLSKRLHDLTEQLNITSQSPSTKMNPPFCLHAPPKSVTMHHVLRNDLMKKIEDTFSVNRNKRKRQTLCGQAGMGKTQLAFQYFHSSTYDSKIWFDASNKDQLIEQYIKLGKKNNLEFHEWEGKRDHAYTVKDWLGQLPNCLVVYDNMPDDFINIGFLPDNIHTLETTRYSTNKSHYIEVCVMTKDEGLALLKKTVPALNHPTEAQLSLMNDLLDQLAYHPQAIVQAGWAIDQSGLSIDKFLPVFNQHKASFIQTVSPPLSLCPEWIFKNNEAMMLSKQPLGHALQLDLMALMNQSLISIELLYHCSFLKASRIPEDLLERSYLLDEWSEVWVELDRYSFFQDNMNRTININPFLQAIIHQSFLNDPDKRSIILKNLNDAADALLVELNNKIPTNNDSNTESKNSDDSSVSNETKEIQCAIDNLVSQQKVLTKHSLTLEAEKVNTTLNNNQAIVPSNALATPISESLTSIKPFAFFGNALITKIQLTDKTTSIGENAFFGCSNLETIDLSQSPLTIIESGTFAGCTRLTHVTLPESITAIADGAFSDCPNLTDINLPSSIKHIGSYAFFNCKSLLKIQPLNSIDSLGQNAFFGCSQLETVDLSKSSLTCIEAGTFSGCAHLKSILLPHTISFIRDSAFSHCGELVETSLPITLRYIGICAFFNCKKLTNIFLPNSIPIIAEKAFYGCDALYHFTTLPNHQLNDITAFLPNTLKSITLHSSKNHSEITTPSTNANNAFSKFPKLSNIDLPESIASLKENLFAKCKALTSITLPQHLFTTDYFTEKIISRRFHKTKISLQEYLPFPPNLKVLRILRPSHPIEKSSSQQSKPDHSNQSIPNTYNIELPTIPSLIDLMHSPTRQYAVFSSDSDKISLFTLLLCMDRIRFPGQYEYALPALPVELQPRIFSFYFVPLEYKAAINLDDNKNPQKTITSKRISMQRFFKPHLNTLNPTIQPVNNNMPNFAPDNANAAR